MNKEFDERSATTTMLNSEPTIISDDDDDEEEVKSLTSNYDATMTGGDVSDLATGSESRDGEGVLLHTTITKEDLQSLAMCILCLAKQVQSLLLSCRHITLRECRANSVDVCPICSERIVGTVRIFLGFSLRKKLI